MAELGEIAGTEVGQRVVFPVAPCMDPASHARPQRRDGEFRLRPCIRPLWLGLDLMPRALMEIRAPSPDQMYGLSWDGQGLLQVLKAPVLTGLPLSAVTAFAIPWRAKISLRYCFPTPRQLPHLRPEAGAVLKVPSRRAQPCMSVTELGDGALVRAEREAAVLSG